MEAEYSKLKAKHNLPDFALLDREFEISTIECDFFILREIRRKIAEKNESAAKIFDDLLHPESGFAHFREAAIFSETDREQLLNLYRRIMYYDRLAIELDFSDSDEINAKFINDFMKEWPALKKQIVSFVVRMKESWQKELPKKDAVRYLG
jgi:hypothetical protein